MASGPTLNFRTILEPTKTNLVLSRPPLLNHKLGRSSHVPRMFDALGKGAIIFHPERLLMQTVQYLLVVASLIYSHLFVAAKMWFVQKINKTCGAKSSNQGRTSGCEIVLLACIHPVTSCRAGWIFHPSMSLDSFGSSKQAVLCIQARTMCAYSFYLVLYILWRTMELQEQSSKNKQQTWITLPIKRSPLALSRFSCYIRIMC